MRANHQSLPGPYFRWLFVKSVRFKRQCSEIFPFVFFNVAYFCICWFSHFSSIISTTLINCELSPSLFFFCQIICLNCKFWAQIAPACAALWPDIQIALTVKKTQISPDSDIHWVRFIDIILTFVINGSHQALKTTDTIKTFWQNSAVFTLGDLKSTIVTFFSGFYCCGVNFLTHQVFEKKTWRPNKLKKAKHSNKKKTEDIGSIRLKGMKMLMISLDL